MLLIGRESHCDLRLSDKKCSREHARIEVNAKGIFITNLNPKNKTWVNGQEIDTYALTPGSEIQIGETVLFFQLEIYEPQKPVQPNLNARANRNSSAFAEEEAAKKKRFYIIVAIVFAAIGALLLSDNKAVEEEAYEFRNEESIAEEISETFKRKQEIESEYYSSGKDTPQYLKAQSNYQRGMREYRERNYNRAISYFSAALSFYPNHELAKRYLTQARRKLDEEVQYTLSMANSLKEKSQYRKAISYYKHVMILINDKDNISYKEAKALLEECQLRLKGGF